MLLLGLLDLGVCGGGRMKGKYSSALVEGCLCLRRAHLTPFPPLRKMPKKKKKNRTISYLPSFQNYCSLHRRVAPNSEQAATTKPQTIGANDISAARKWTASAFLVALLAAPKAVSVTFPDPAVAVPLLSVPSS